MTRKKLYGLVGFLLGLGAPAGGYLLRLLFFDKQPLQELTTNGFFYLYMLVGTCAFFALFGILLGEKADEALIRIQNQDKLLAHLSSQIEELAHELKIRCHDCETVQLMEKQVLQAEKLAAVGRFASSIAHEINNPLMGIKNALAMMTHPEIPAAKRQEYGQLIQEGFSKIEETIRNVLQFAKHQEITKKEMNIATSIKKALALCENQIQKKGILLDKAIPEEELLVLGDEKQLQQVFLNLFLNAYDAMKSGDMLTVAAYRQNGNIICKVSDTGAGIEKEHLPHIFDPFFTTKAKGTGLGLSVTQTIVEKHNGEIQVQSQPGLGTTFILSFPECQKS